MESTEKWLPVVGYECQYEVSDHGRVRGLDRLDRFGRLCKARIKAQMPNRDGYMQVDLYQHGKLSKRLAHTLVLTAFVGPRPEGMNGCHGDGNPANNVLGNLRWATQAENAADTVRHGRHWQLRKTHCKKGHPLEHPNLVPGELKRKRGAGRSCLICHKAYNEAKNARRRAERAAARAERERARRE